MSQHDFNLANAAGAAFRADMNNALLAIVSNSSGATAPSTTFAYQWWLDTTAGLLKIRNAANTAWITVGDVSLNNIGLASVSGSTFTGQLLAAVGSVSLPGVAFSGDTDSGFYWVSANTWELVSGGVAYLRVSSAGITFLGTGATQLPSGTTAQRPGSPVNGMIRYNSDTLGLDAYVNGAWKAIPAVSAYPFTTADIANKVEAVMLRPFDFSNTTTTTLIYPQFPWSAPIKQADPATLPTGNGLACAMTPNGEYVAIGHSTTPFLSFYQRKATELVKLTNPTLPASEVLDAAFSQSGEYFACAHATTPFVSIYIKSTGANPWTKLANPATLPAGAGTGVAFSPNGEFIVVTHATTPFFTCYQRSGTTFTKIANPATLPTGQGNGAAWSPDGRFLMIAHTSSPFMSIYERTAGTTLTKLANPATLPLGNGMGCAISNDNNYFVLAHATSPFCTVYSRSGTTFTKLVAGDTSQFTNSANLPPAQGNRVSFALDSSMFAVAHNSSPFVTVYTVPDTAIAFPKLSNPATLPTGTGTGVFFSYEKEFLLTSHNTTPFLTFYQTASDMPDVSVVTIKKILRDGV